MPKQYFKIIGFLICIIMFGLFNSMQSQENKTQLRKAIQEGALLVDVRTANEFLEGHIAGSINIPLDQVTSQLDTFKNQKHIIVFCQSGNRSEQAKKILEKQGFTNSINGGGWKSLNDLINKE